MSAVVLASAWIHLASDTSRALALRVAPGLSTPVTGTGVARPYANGRIRLVRRAGESRSVTVTVNRASRAQVERLREWVDTEVLFRDPRGTMWVGFYSTVDPIWTEADEVASVSLTLSYVTTTELV